MTARLRLLVAAVVLFCSAPLAAADDPYPVDVWAQVSYDTEGRATTVDFPDRGDYPAAFLAHLEALLRERTIEPRQLDGQPAVFETGVHLDLTVTPGEGGGSVSVDAIEIMPRALRIPAARMPPELVASGWEGVVLARCTVNPKGRCGRVRVETTVGVTPNAARQFAKQSLAGWLFQPQMLNGQPIESEITIPFRIHAGPNLRRGGRRLL